MLPLSAVPDLSGLDLLKRSAKRIASLYYDVNVEGAKNVLNAMDRLGHPSVEMKSKMRIAYLHQYFFK